MTMQIEKKDLTLIARAVRDGGRKINKATDRAEQVTWEEISKIADSLMTHYEAPAEPEAREKDKDGKPGKTALGKEILRLVRVYKKAVETAKIPQELTGQIGRHITNMLWIKVLPADLKILLDGKHVPLSSIKSVSALQHKMGKFKERAGHGLASVGNTNNGKAKGTDARPESRPEAHVAGNVSAAAADLTQPNTPASEARSIIRAALKVAQTAKVLEEVLAEFGYVKASVVEPKKARAASKAKAA